SHQVTPLELLSPVSPLPVPLSHLTAVPRILPTEESCMRVRNLFAVVAALAISMGIWGCSQNKASNPSYKDAVQTAMENDGFKDVKVDEDRDKNLITLDGNVKTEDEKAKAEADAKAAAPGMIVANQILVQPAGMESEAKKSSSAEDKAIEEGFKA